MTEHARDNAMHKYDNSMTDGHRERNTITQRQIIFGDQNRNKKKLKKSHITCQMVVSAYACLLLFIAKWEPKISHIEFSFVCFIYFRFLFSP